MKAATRKKLLAYAIPIDLVVVATGIGLLIPGIPSVAIVAVYVVAVALSAWKSGWAGAIAAMVLSSVLLFFLFHTSVPRDQIGWLLAAGVVASIPLASLYASRVRRRLRRLENVLLVEPTVAGPQSIEEAAAEAISRPRYAAEREAQVRADSERIAAPRVAAQDAKSLEARRAELQAAYDSERASLKAEFDAARLNLAAERAELQQRPPVIEKHIDEEALAQRLEHLRAELQQQFEREMQPRIDAALARQREALARDSDREIAKIRAAAEERIAVIQAELDLVLAQPSVAPRARQPVPMQRGIFSRFFHPRSSAPLKLNRVVISGESTANRRAAARSVLKKPEADAAPRRYDVICANCHVMFDAADADWCSCLTRDRTVVCTNCLTCFCKSAPAYKEIFWSDAPPQLLDRKAAELRRQSLTMAANAAPSEVRRPLVMLVDNDPDNQAIMQRVCANLGYGALSSDGQDALAMARAYRPNLI